MRYSLPVLSLTLLLLSCNSDDGPSTTELLQGKTWMFSSMIEEYVDRGEIVTSTEIFQPGPHTEFEDCDRDDLYTFREDGILHYSPGDLMCNEHDVEEFLGNYVVNGNKIDLMGEMWDIIDVSSRNFVIENKDVEEEVTYVFRLTFSVQ